MTTKKTPSFSEPSQLDKFKDAARELECDNDEMQFRERVGKLLKLGPQKKREP